MLNVLNGQSNGSEKDKAWGWKSSAELDAARNGNKRTVQRDFEEFLDASPSRPKDQARL